jgi:hypothetical protein
VVLHCGQGGRLGGINATTASAVTGGGETTTRAAAGGRGRAVLTSGPRRSAVEGALQSGARLSAGGGSAWAGRGACELGQAACGPRRREGQAGRPVERATTASWARWA